jgi:hypothetical protein
VALILDVQALTQLASHAEERRTHPQLRTLATEKE